jgi:hypothetical protein
MVINLPVPKVEGISRVALQLLASQKDVLLFEFGVVRVCNLLSVLQEPPQP